METRPRTHFPTPGKLGFITSKHPPRHPNTPLALHTVPKLPPHHHYYFCKVAPTPRLPTPNNGCGSQVMFKLEMEIKLTLIFLLRFSASALSCSISPMSAPLLLITSKQQRKAKGLLHHRKSGGLLVFPACLLYAPTNELLKRRKVAKPLVQRTNFPPPSTFLS